MPREPTQQELRRLFRYDPGTGEVIRRVAVKGNAAGSVVGTQDKDGYTVACVHYRCVKLHRLVWCYTYGYWPENDVDHINRDPSDNRLCNLREVSRSCNLQNARTRSDNTSGVKGVCLSINGKWRVFINLNGKQYHLGVFVSFSEAKAHRKAAEQCLGWCQGGRHASIRY